jgi:hypothetical protein
MVRHIMNVTVVTGRRIDAAGAKPPRFPLANVPAVRLAITRLLRETKAEAVVCSAACGTDLIALDIASELAIPAWVELPFDRQRFRETSVTDRPGDWGPLYDRLLDQAEQQGRLNIIATMSDDHEAYVRTVDAMLDRATTLATVGDETSGRSGEPRGVTALAVWDGVSRGPDDLTAAFIKRARQRGVAVREIST